MEIEPDFDIYENLPNQYEENVQLTEEVAKLHKQVKLQEDHIHSLENDIEKLCCKIRDMKKVQDNLTKNISSLYKTAKAEIDRKDKIINELRSQLEQYTLQQRNFNKWPKRSRESSPWSYKESDEFEPKRMKRYEDSYERSRHGSTPHSYESFPKSKEEHGYREMTKEKYRREVPYNYEKYGTEYSQRKRENFYRATNKEEIRISENKKDKFNRRTPTDKEFGKKDKVKNNVTNFDTFFEVDKKSRQEINEIINIYNREDNRVVNEFMNPGTYTSKNAADFINKSASAGSHNKQVEYSQVNKPKKASSPNKKMFESRRKTLDIKVTKEDNNNKNVEVPKDHENGKSRVDTQKSIASEAIGHISVDENLSNEVNLQTDLDFKTFHSIGAVEKISKDKKDSKVEKSIDDRQIQTESKKEKSLNSDKDGRKQETFLIEHEKDILLINKQEDKKEKILNETKKKKLLSEAKKEKTLSDHKKENKDKILLNKEVKEELSENDTKQQKKEELKDGNRKETDREVLELGLATKKNNENHKKEASKDENKRETEVNIEKLQLECSLKKNNENDKNEAVSDENKKTHKEKLSRDYSRKENSEKPLKEKKKYLPNIPNKSRKKTVSSTVTSSSCANEPLQEKISSELSDIEETAISEDKPFSNEETENPDFLYSLGSKQNETKSVVEKGEIENDPKLSKEEFSISGKVEKSKETKASKKRKNVKLEDISIKLQKRLEDRVEEGICNVFDTTSDQNCDLLKQDIFEIVKSAAFAKESETANSRNTTVSKDTNDCCAQNEIIDELSTSNLLIEKNKTTDEVQVNEEKNLVSLENEKKEENINSEKEEHDVINNRFRRQGNKDFKGKDDNYEPKVSKRISSRKSEKEPKSSQDSKSKKLEETKVEKESKEKTNTQTKKEKLSDGMSRRVLRSATKRSCSKEKTDICTDTMEEKTEKHQSHEDFAFIHENVISEVVISSNGNLTHDGEIPTLHISENYDVLNTSSESLIEMNLSLSTESLDISTKSETNANNNKDVNNSFSRKRRRVVCTLID